MQISHQFYISHLTKINEIPFSRREIDIISFLISGRSAKKIAAFFNISPKTVEFHSGRIMQKLSCNSRESIIDFVEKSPQYHYLKIYHTRLIAEDVFENLLKKLPEMSGKSPTLYVWIDNSHQEEVSLFQKHLKCAGFKLSPIQVGETELLPNLSKDGSLVRIDPLKHSTSEEASTLFLQENSFTKEELDIISNNDSLTIKTYNFEEYFSFFLSFLKIYFSKKQIDAHFGDFIKNHLSTEIPSIAAQDKKISVRELFTTRPGVSIVSGIILFICMAFIITISLGKKSSESSLYHPLLSAELYLPPEDKMLNRKKLLAAIKESFNSPHKIQTTLLLGIGGAGKTTLARQIARSSSSEIIWEFNAETKESLIKSYEQFAQAICNSEADVKSLAELDGSKNDAEREAKLLAFIRQKLKQRPNWFLVFDNMENLSSLQKYIPNDINVWGAGSVLLTSRDKNIRMNNLVGHTIEVGELNASEKLTLFQTISGSKAAQQEQLHKFLNEIPPYPLDISLAAQYLMTTNVTYEEYLKSLSESKAEFINLQKSILMDSGPYKINRLHIIALTLDKLIDENPDFAELILFMSLINSQTIPQGLLKLHKDPVIVDKFMYHCKKYSIISEDEKLPSQKNSTLSMHRTIQKISLAYLKKKLPEQEIHRSISSISNTLNVYMTQAIEHEDAAILIPLITISESFLECGEMTPVPMVNSLKIGLGWIYGYLGDYAKAKNYLEPMLKCTPHDLKQTSRVLAYLGNIYRELGDFKNSEKFLQKSQTILENQFPNHWSDIAFVNANLGFTHRYLGNYVQAKEQLETGLNLYRTHLHDNYLGVARTLGYLGNVHKELGEHAKAQAYLEETKKYYMQHLPNHYMDLAVVYYDLGTVYKELGQVEKSKSLLEESLHLYKKNLPLSHTNVAWVLGHLGGAYLELNEMSKAKNALEERLKSDSDDVSNTQPDVTEIFIDLSRPILTNQVPSKPESTDVLSNRFLGYNYRNLGDYVKAKSYLDKSLQGYKMHFPQNHIGIARDLAFLGSVHKELGSNTKAVALLEESKKYYKQYFPENFRDLASVLITLGMTYKELDQRETAKANLVEGLNLYKKHLPPNHPLIEKSCGYLRNLEFGK